MTGLPPVGVKVESINLPDAPYPLKGLLIDVVDDDEAGLTYHVFEVSAGQPRHAFIPADEAKVSPHLRTDVIRSQKRLIGELIARGSKDSSLPAILLRLESALQ